MFSSVRRSPHGLHGLWLLFALLPLLNTACEPAVEAPRMQQSRAALEQTQALTLEALPSGPFTATDEVFLRAPWGDEDEAFERELLGAQTGPMAMTALGDGGLAILDTVAGQVHRYDQQGSLREISRIGVETGDDLASLPDGGFAVLAYRRLPRPSYEVLRFAVDGGAPTRVAVPAAITLPTALLAEGDRLYVEHRHRHVRPLDGSPRLSGRPEGEAAIRARLTENGRLRLSAAERRSGQPLWQVELGAERPITEILALETSSELVCVVLRFVEEIDLEANSPALQSTWLVTFDDSGHPLGRIELRDQRVTDASHPFALSDSGDFFELVTTDQGVNVLRYTLMEGGSR